MSIHILYRVSFLAHHMCSSLFDRVYCLQLIREMNKYMKKNVKEERSIRKRIIQATKWPDQLVNYECVKIIEFSTPAT